jgi:predicted ribosomally synthesized peptide with nif11-like leader
MSTFNKIKEFLVRIVKDDEFRASVESQPNPTEQSQFLQEAGYNFTPGEFDAAAIKILELAEQGKFTELGEKELVAVMGGQAGVGDIWFWRRPKPGGGAIPLYGVSIPPNWTIE